MPKPKLTPEERRELKKQKKLKIEEKKRQIKRDHLKREVNYGQFTVKKYEQNWRKMLIKATLPRMKEDLEFAWHNFERVIDCKDYQISLLLDEIREAEDQYMLNFICHLENMDKLMGIFSDRLDDFKKDYEDEVKKLQLRCDCEIEDTKGVNNENMNYLKTMLHQLEVARRGHERMKRAEYYSRLDETEVKNQLSLQKLQTQIEKKFQDVFNNAKRFVNDYEKSLRGRREKHHKLKEGDDSIQQLIGQQLKQMKKLYDTLRHLRQKFGDLKQTEGSKLTELQFERKYFASSYRSLKGQLAEDQQDDFIKLSRLSESSACALDCFDNLIKKGEMILKMAAVCRKLETQKEKILHFPSNDAGTVLEPDRIGEDDEETTCLKKEMELFWQRFGLAYSTHFALKKERQFLNEENRLFIDFHNDYCEQLAYPPGKKDPGKITITKIDANIEMKKYQ